MKTEVLKYCDVGDLDKWEIHFINKFNTKTPYGYNLCDGGGGIRGYKRTELSKKKNSESHCKRRKRPGYITFVRKKYIVKGPEPLCRYIGSFKVKEDAEKALTKFNKTGKVSTLRTNRKKGSGSIWKRKNGTYMISYQGPKRTCYSIEEAEQTLSKWIETGVVPHKKC